MERRTVSHAWEKGIDIQSSREYVRRCHAQVAPVSLHPRFVVTKPEDAITVWAFEQESGCRRTFETQDVYVDWKDRSGTKLGTRYYHMFKKNELDELLMGKNDYNVIYEKGNWVYKISKGRPS